MSTEAPGHPSAASAASATTTLSVVIATKNEASNILKALASVRFADELVVLDSGSTDNTVELARSVGARVIHSDWPGFGPQKQRLLHLATKEWVFVLDADECVTPELQAEILQSIQRAKTSGINGYWVPRLSKFCGQFIHHCGWYPDRTLRLAKRDAARFTSHLVHERMEVSGPTTLLRQHMLHYSYPDVESVLIKLDRYSSAGALDLYQRSIKTSLSSALGHGLWAFIRTYLLKTGFLDGRMGFVLSFYNAQASYYKYIKLMMLWSKSNKND